MPDDKTPKSAEKVAETMPDDAPAAPRADQGRGGRFLPGNKISAKGGRAKAHKARLATAKGISEHLDAPGFRPYRQNAKRLTRAYSRGIAATVGDGVCGVGPSTLAASAALLVAMSRYMTDEGARTGNPHWFVTAARLAAEARGSLKDAYALAAQEAQARAEAVDPTDDLATLLAPPKQNERNEQ